MQQNFIRKGDKVKILQSGASGAAVKAGDILTVQSKQVAMDTVNGIIYCYRPDGSGATWSFRLSEVQLIGLEKKDIQKDLEDLKNKQLELEAQISWMDATKSKKLVSEDFKRWRLQQIIENEKPEKATELITQLFL
jgi:hypothetical protein